MLSPTRDFGQFVDLLDVRGTIQTAYARHLPPSALAENLPNPDGVQLDSGIVLRFQANYSPELWSNWGTIPILNAVADMKPAQKFDIIRALLPKFQAVKFWSALAPGDDCFALRQREDGQALFGLQMGIFHVTSEEVLHDWHELLEVYLQMRAMQESRFPRND